MRRRMEVAYQEEDGGGVQRVEGIQGGEGGVQGGGVQRG